MNVAEVKDQVASRVAEKRGLSGGLTRSGSFGADTPQLSKLTPFLIGGSLLGLAGWLFLRPAPVPTSDTGNAQIDQAMGMLQQQQDINRELLKGQQELNAQMIRAQSQAKQQQPSVTCILAVCPGTGKTEQPQGDYAIVGESIKTATVDPARVLPQLRSSVQQVEYYHPPRQVNYAPQTIEFAPEVVASLDQTLRSQLEGCRTEGWQTSHCDAVKNRILEVAFQ